jgi:hypothetical protein
MLRSLPLCPFCGKSDAKLVSQSNHRSATNGTPIGLPPLTVFLHRCTCGCSFSIAVPALTKPRGGKLPFALEGRFCGRVGWWRFCPTAEPIMAEPLTGGAMRVIRYEADLVLRKDRFASLRQLQQNLKRDTPYTVKLVEMEGGIFCLSVSSESEIDRDAIIEAGAAFKIAREYWKFTNELGQ